MPRPTTRAAARRVETPDAAAHPRAIGDLIWLPVLAAIALAAYYPAVHGGLLWDDDRHLTSAALRSLSGLRRIWFDLGATQQYYPVTHSAFWVQHALWGDQTFGYHLVNVILHACSSFLLLRILRRLAIPGATLAAVVFALHPIHVESVAWMTELKNTLSGTLVLSSALLYLRFTEQRSTRTYAGALVLFVLALLAKSVVAPVAGVLLIVAWWKRERLDIRRDVAPLVPFLVLGAASGLVTAWVERTMIGAQGTEFQLSLVERVLVAGRVFWFYLATLVWPQHLSFNYPRWSVSAAEWTQFLYPLGAMAAMAACWFWRSRTKAPLTACLAYVALIFPVLGFLAVYPFRFSFVADHFAYLASIPVIAAACAAGARAMDRAKTARAVRVAPGIAAALTLGLLTAMHARHFTSAESLYRHVLERNPSSWLAHNNLAVALAPTNLDEALFHANEAVALNPSDPSAHNDRGTILQRAGNTAAAIAEFREAVRLEPGFATAHNNLCNSLDIAQRYAEAMPSCREALELAPDFADAHYNLGVAMLGLGLAQAADEFTAAVALRPGFAEAHYSLAGLLELRGQLDDARRHYEDATRLKPDLPEAHLGLGRVLQQMSRDAEAIPQYEAALRLDPGSAEAHNALGTALTKVGRAPEALPHFEEAVRLMPSFGEARANLIRARESAAPR